SQARLHRRGPEFSDGLNGFCLLWRQQSSVLSLPLG
ncbi:hypothetical protein E2320_014082, partial [Naja naja]